MTSHFGIKYLREVLVISGSQSLLVIHPYPKGAEAGYISIPRDSPHPITDGCGKEESYKFPPPLIWGHLEILTSPTVQIHSSLTAL